MSHSETREPIQKRSIEKKKKIVKAGFNLICEKGYYNITTADIAKYAGVSTGIVYSYFNDKHDILIDGIKEYVESLLFPLIHTDIKMKINNKNLKKFILKILNALIDEHKISKLAHEELMAMAHLDNEVAQYFNNFELELNDSIVQILLNNNFQISNLNEKVHIAIGIVENFSHEIVYHKHKEMDYKIMKKIVIETLLSLFN